MENWSSFGRVIGEANEQISVEEDETPGATVEGADIDERFTLRAIMGICVTYRIILAGNMDYRTKLNESALNIFAMLGYESYEFMILIDHYKPWMSYKPFRMMMAGIDLFLHKFPEEHPYAMTRFGSVSARFRDSAAIGEIFFIHKITSLKYRELAQWIWSDKIADQFSAVLNTEEEIEQEYSYATCAIDFYLTIRSQYGNDVNPDLHLWIHTIGVSMQEARSVNARVVGKPDKSATFANAMLVAYVMQRNPNLGKQFGALTEALDDVDELELGAENELLVGRDPNIWLGFIKQKENNIPIAI